MNWLFQLGSFFESPNFKKTGIKMTRAKTIKTQLVYE
jgi:hypothetical protein